MTLTLYITNYVHCNQLHACSEKPVAGRQSSLASQRASNSGSRERTTAAGRGSPGNRSPLLGQDCEDAFLTSRSSPLTTDRADSALATSAVAKLRQGMSDRLAVSAPGNLGHDGDRLATSNWGMTTGFCVSVCFWRAGGPLHGEPKEEGKEGQRDCNGASLWLVSGLSMSPEPDRDLRDLWPILPVGVVRTIVASPPWRWGCRFKGQRVRRYICHKGDDPLPL